MDLDAIVIGAGQAGVPLAVRLAGEGRRVLLAERARPGGTCVNVGCTPTKTLVATARAAHVARTASRLGVEAGPVRVDFPTAIARKDEMVRRWREGVERRIAGAGEGLRLVLGHARFAGPREVELNGERHRAPVVVVNAGARPAVPELAGLDAVPWLDNARIMELRALPEHLVVLGGGYIGCEFAQMFRRFGAEVTVVDHNPHLLAREDEDVSAEVEAFFRAEGIGLALGARVERVDGAQRSIRLTLADRQIRGTHLLVAAGRRPNTDDLGLDLAGVALDPQGYVVVDDHYRTSAEGVFAVGDVTPGPQFTHVSWDDHRRLHAVLSGRPGGGRSGRVVPHVVYTDPQVAGVGLNEREARRRSLVYDLATLPYARVARAVETDETAGLMKLLVDPRSEAILGASLVGAEAGEIVHVLASLMHVGAKAGAVAEMIHAHPAFSEGLQSLAMRLPRYAG
jgi:pyruvate/2-oxoglutarate dehydrogenase complex dihydrolipoamide dehydrogenase (E3) component